MSSVSRSTRHVRGVLVEERIELANEDGELVAAVGRRHARREVAGLKNAARCIGDFAQRTRRAPCRTTCPTATERTSTAAPTSPNARRSGASSTALLSVLRPAWIKRPSNSVREAIGVIAQCVLRQAHGWDRAFRGHAPFGNRNALDDGLHPVRRSFHPDGPVAGIDHANEPRAPILRCIAVELDRRRH